MRLLIPILILIAMFLYGVGSFAIATLNKVSYCTTDLDCAEKNPHLCGQAYEPPCK